MVYPCPKEKQDKTTRQQDNTEMTHTQEARTRVSNVLPTLNIVLCVVEAANTSLPLHHSRCNNTTGVLWSLFAMLYGYYYDYIHYIIPIYHWCVQCDCVSHSTTCWMPWFEWWKTSPYRLVWADLNANQRTRVSHCDDYRCYLYEWFVNNLWMYENKFGHKKDKAISIF